MIFLPFVLHSRRCRALPGGADRCDRIKQRVLEIVEQTQPPPPPSPVPEAKPLTPEEEAMNEMLQDPKLFDAATAATEEAPVAPVIEINKAATVAVLGYHDFRERGGTPMIIAGSKFRQQMQAIKDAKLPVIPMSDLLAWKRGEKNIPEEAVVITMDDGWEGVYEDCLPDPEGVRLPLHHLPRTKVCEHRRPLADLGRDQAR